MKDISKQTGISVDDIVDTLNELKLVKVAKGKHVLVVGQKVGFGFFCFVFRFKLIFSFHLVGGYVFECTHEEDKVRKKERKKERKN